MQQQAFSNVNNFVMAENVSEVTVATIKENSLTMPGVEIVETSTRSYDEGSIIPHVLGRVGKITAEKWKVTDENGQTTYPLREKGYNMNAADTGPDDGRDERHQEVRQAQVVVERIAGHHIHAPARQSGEQTRAEVTRGIHGKAGQRAEAGADERHQQTDEQAAQIALGSRIAAIHQGIDQAHEHGRDDELHEKGLEKGDLGSASA